jgi:dihydropteroate synthase
LTSDSIGGIATHKYTEIMSANVRARIAKLEANLQWGRRTYVMAIVNVTPDSFSGDGAGDDLEAALARAHAAILEGADILDVGGESTRPGADAVPEDVELGRVLPVVEALARQFDVAISIDTYKARVAQRALEAGASMVNDVWALRRDPEMANVVAHFGAFAVLMHNRLAKAKLGELGGYFPSADYADVVEDVVAELHHSVALAELAGVSRTRIIADPGLGFGKTPEQTRELLKRLAEVRSRLGLPVLVGPSRKSFAGLVTGTPPTDRLPETLAATTLCVSGGADLVRVHDVLPNVRACRVADAVVRAWPPST